MILSKVQGISRYEELHQDITFNILDIEIKKLIRCQKILNMVGLTNESNN